MSEWKVESVDKALSEFRLVLRFYDDSRHGLTSERFKTIEIVRTRKARLSYIRQNAIVESENVV